MTSPTMDTSSRCRRSERSCPAIRARVRRLGGAVGMSLLFVHLPASLQAAPVVINAGLDQSGARDEGTRAFERAKAAVRAAKRDHPDAKRIEVQLAAGDYDILAPLRFTPDDGGSSGLEVVYCAAEGARVTIRGSVPVGEWRKEADGIWSAAIPDVPADLRVDDLFAGADALPRARYPATGWMSPAQGWGGGGAVLPVSKDLLADAGLFGGLDDQTISLQFLHMWFTSIVHVTGVDEPDSKLLTRPPIGAPFFTPDMLGMNPWPRFCLYNGKSMMKRAGNWRVDEKARRIYYLPKSGQSPESLILRAPASKGLLEIRGSGSNRVQNLHFQGLHFLHSRFDNPAGGYLEIQAGKYQEFSGRGQPEVKRLPGALVFAHAEDCSIAGSSIEGAGAAAISIGANTRRVEIRNCKIPDAGGSAISVGTEANIQNAGGPALPEAGGEPGAVPEGIRLLDNEIARAGRRFSGAPGIWVGIAAGTLISGNYLGDLPYTGISVGWKWSAEPTEASGNVITSNRIARPMQLLLDGGGIYMLGYQPKSVIGGNYIEDMHPGRGSFNRNGIYMDEGSAGVLVERNVLYQVRGPMMRFHKAGNNAVRNNLFMGPQTNAFEFAGAGRESMEWENNIELIAPPSGPNYDRDGVSGSCLSEGSYSVQHAAAQEPQQFTAAAWVRGAPPQPGFQDWRAWVLAKTGNETNAGHFGLLVGRDGSLAGILNFGPLHNGPYICRKMGPAFPLDGAWHHAAMTYDGKAVSLFVDGREVHSEPAPASRPVENGAISVRGRPDGYGDGIFFGSVDEAILLRGALSAGEISKLAALTAEGTELPKDLSDRVWFRASFEPQAMVSPIDTMRAIFAPPPQNSRADTTPQP